MRLAFVSAAILTASVSQAATPIDGWYSSIFGGYAYLSNNINNTQFGLARSHASYDAGYDVGGSLGFKSTPMRYEGELTYLNANLKKFNINNIQQTGVGGYNDDVLAMAKVYYDFPNLLMAIQPYVGVGIGYAWVQARLNSTGPSAITRFSGSNSVFAYQGTAGLTYNFAENYALTLDYRYIATKQANNLGKIVQAQLANLGVVYRFDGRN